MTTYEIFSIYIPTAGVRIRRSIDIVFYSMIIYVSNVCLFKCSNAIDIDFRITFLMIQ